MNNEQLLAITSNMPMKTICVNDQPYLERHFAGFAEDGGQWWYHRFVRADAERHLHTHPWEGRALVLCGGYIEQLRPVGQTDPRNDRRRYFKVGDTNQIYPTTLHRIVAVEANTWTLLHIKPGREPTWAFIDDEGKREVMQASLEDWFLNFTPRQAA
jgi:hypothetical protein